MRAQISISFVALAIILGGCLEDEQTLYVEHIKVQPAPPECSVSPGDNSSPGAGIDIALAWEYSSYFLVTNGTMVREDFDNIRNETNGIIIDGMESYIVTEGNERISDTEYFEYEDYIPPETSDVVAGMVISQTAIETLRSAYNCPKVNSENYSIGDIIESGSPSWRDFPEVYARIRFVGHTKGNHKVKTAEFSYRISLCCNCQVNWSGCNSECSFYCEEPVESETCNPGVFAGNGGIIDCRILFSDKRTWSEQKCEDECSGS